jgi:hypothetical protein
MRLYLEKICKDIWSGDDGMGDGMGRIGGAIHDYLSIMTEAL